MNRKLNKLIASFSAFVILLSSVACSTGNESGKENSGKVDTDTNVSADENDEMEKAKNDPFAPYPETIEYTTGLEVNTWVSFPEGSDHTPENNGITKFYKEKLNIQPKLAWEAVDGQDYEQKLSTTLTTSNVPDILRVDYQTFLELVENDLVADLTEAYENTASDLMKEIYGSNDNKALDMATIDGKLYAIPTTAIASGPQMLWLRKDWMDNLGLEEPKTIEDIEKILTAFKNEDPDGNGENDTIGLSLKGADGGFMGSYGGGFEANALFAYNNAFPKQWIEKDGEIVYGSIQPEMKETLALLADWFNKGLIDPELASDGWNEAKAKIQNGTSGAMFCMWSAPYDLEPSIALNPDAEWKPYIVPINEDGSVTVWTGDPNQNYHVVAKGFEHPEMLIKAKNLSLEYNQGSGAYTDDSEVAKEYLDYVNEGYGVDPIGGFDWWNAAELSYERISEALNGERDPEEMISYENSLYNSSKKYLEAVEKGEQPNSTDWLNYTARIVAGELLKTTNMKEVNPVFFASTESMPLLWPSLQKLEEAAMLEILTGQKPLEYFDTFVNEWTNNGGNQITEEVREFVEKNN